MDVGNVGVAGKIDPDAIGNVCGIGLRRGNGHDSGASSPGTDPGRTHAAIGPGRYATKSTA